MPIRDQESNRQRQPRRFSRKVRKSLENTYRKYNKAPRVDVRFAVNEMMCLNRTVALKGLKRVNKFGVAVATGYIHDEKHPDYGSFYHVVCHGSHTKRIAV